MDSATVTPMPIPASPAIVRARRAFAPKDIPVITVNSDLTTEASRLWVMATMRLRRSAEGQAAGVEIPCAGPRGSRAVARNPLQMDNALEAQ